MHDLFPVALRGVGTVDVEALGSYMHQLARVHCVSVDRLMKYVYARYAKKNPSFRQTIPSLRTYGSLAKHIRPNRTTQDVVEALSFTTGRTDLRCGTFLALALALERSMCVFSQHFRWCPACMREFEKADDPGYFKLIWQLQSLEFCPTHRVQLIDKCVHCNSHQDGFSYKVDAVTCQKCRLSLTTEINTNQLAVSWETQAVDLLELVNQIAKNPLLLFPTGGVKSVVSALFDKAWESHKELEFWDLISRDECLTIISGEKPMTLTIARRLAVRLGVNLPDLLLGEIEMLPGILDTDWFKDLPPEFIPKKRKINRDRDKIHDAILEIINKASEESPLPLKKVAETIGVSTGYLHYHFSVLSNQIIQTHKKWQHQQQLEMRKTARAAALEYFTSRQNKVVSRSRKEAFRIIREETGLPKNMLREEINAVYRILNSYM